MISTRPAAIAIKLAMLNALDSTTARTGPGHAAMASWMPRPSNTLPPSLSMRMTSSCDGSQSASSDLKVALDYDRDMNRKLVLSKNAGSKMPRREYTRGELFHMLLIKSDNAAAETLASDYPGGRQRFMRHMNSRALMLDMFNTHFDDPSGLSKYNVSTASDVTQMVIESANYPEIRDISTKKVTAIETPGKRKNRMLVLHNTNTAILSQVNNVQVSKTGYTNPAGFCVALLVHKIDGDKEYHEVIVVMGARNSAHRVDTVKRVVYNEVTGDNYDTTSRI